MLGMSRLRYETETFVVGVNEAARVVNGLFFGNDGVEKQRVESCLGEK